MTAGFHWKISLSSAILKNPRVQFFPKQSMRDATGKVKMRVVNQYPKKVVEENEEEEGRHDDNRWVSLRIAEGFP